MREFFAIINLLTVFILVQANINNNENSSNFIKKIASAGNNGDKNSSSVNAININKSVDSALKKISNIMLQKNLDPLYLDDYQEDFDVKDPLGVLHHGYIMSKKGWAQDMSKIQRDGNAYCNVRLTKWHIKVPLRLPRVEFGSDWKMKLGLLIKKSGGAFGEVDDITMYMYAVFDVIRREVTLKNFDITDMGKIHVKITGTPVIDWWVNPFIDAMTNMLHEEIVEAVNATANILAPTIVDIINHYIP